MNSSYPSPRARVRVVPIAAAQSAANTNERGRETLEPRPRLRIRAVPNVGPAGAQTEAPRLFADAEAPRKKAKRLPNKGSFKPNQSGNLKGRPKGAKGVKAMVRKGMSTPIEIQTAKGPKKVAIIEGLLKKEMSLAAEGDWRARKTMFDLAKWVASDSVDQPFSPDQSSQETMTDTGKAIIAWFTDEIIAQPRDAGEKQ